MTDEDSTALLKGMSRFSKGKTDSGLSKETETEIARLVHREDEDDDEIPGLGKPVSPSSVYGAASGSATVGKTEEDEDDEETKKALRGLFGEIISKYANGYQANLMMKEFDDILAQIFHPHGGSENFVNLRTPGQPSGKIPASPGVSGSSTGYAGQGSMTYPNDESGVHTPDQPYFGNPTDVPRGSGATTGMPRERALNQQYGSTASVTPYPTTKPGDAHERGRERGIGTPTTTYGLENGGKTVSKAREIVSWALASSSSNIEKGRVLIPKRESDEDSTDRTAWGKPAPGLGAGSSDRETSGVLGEEDDEETEEDRRREDDFREAERYDSEAKKRDEAARAFETKDKVTSDSLKKQAIALRAKAVEIRSKWISNPAF